MVEHPPLLLDRELSRPALVLARQFIQRWDAHARQLDDGRYVCVHEPLNVGHLMAHLRGELTLGTYLLDRDSQARYVVIDADDDRGAEGLARLARELAEKEVPVYLERSRRGGHLWLFFSQAVPGKEARSFGQSLLACHHLDDVELFPKQDELRAGPGSLIRLPFGVHRLTGKRYGFVTSAGDPLAGTVRAQIAKLGDPETVPKEAFDWYRSIIVISPEEALSEPKDVATDVVSEKVKASTTVLEFVSQYVDLKPTASGAVGLCPFHDDYHPSFAVNDLDDYWNCFAGCGGGSVIDFYMKWQEVDFTTAIRELALMLLT